MDNVIVFVAQYFVILSIAIAGVAWLRLSTGQKWALAVTGITGGVAVLGLITLTGKLYYDPRPFVAHHLHPLFAHAADNGFPSDHATLTMFLALCVLFYSPLWGSVLVLNALLVGTARVLAHVHSPLDIVAGFALAVVAAVLARLAAPWIVRKLPLAPAQAEEPHGGTGDRLTNPRK